VPRSSVESVSETIFEPLVIPPVATCVAVVVKTPTCVVVPLISTLPLISIKVAFNSISSVALISNIAFDGAPID